jgi:hypothetical protein
MTNADEQPGKRIARYRHNIGLFLLGAVLQMRGSTRTS